MHSAEPFDRRSVNDPSQPALANEAWRAEIASRVHSYRARRKSGEDEAYALDFGPASAAAGPAVGPYTQLSPVSDAPRPAADRTGSESAGAPEPRVTLDALSRAAAPGPDVRKPAGNAFDTNYYRRLNAQAIEQSVMTTGAATAMVAEELESGYETGSAEDNDAPDTGVAMPSAALAIDMELHPAVTGNAYLERYCISGIQPGSQIHESVAASEASPAASPATSSVAPPVASPAADPAQAASAAQGNLIVFPRPLLEPPLLQPPSRDELAEPVNHRPRILEVPEDIMPAMQGSLFPEIRLDGDEPESCAVREPEIEVPLRVAPVSARFVASLADAAVVMTAGVLFAAIACYAIPDMPRTKPFWMMMGAATMLFWAIYQCLFLLYAGRTLGMSMTGLHLSTFDGRAPEWAERRRRARFVLISFASVALGFLWALVDEDALCWHDRVSRTFPTAD
jgi:uncharacterized RDD family membrane protein YckC